jgi:hypothetical protein
MTMQSFVENQTFFKRNFAASDGPVFTETEQKILRLALDPAATASEADVCGSKLIQSLRKRGVGAEAIVAHMTRSTWVARELMAARGRVVDFGKHKGKTVGELPRSYIEWALRECDNLSFNLRRAMTLVLNART